MMKIGLLITLGMMLFSFLGFFEHVPISAQEQNINIRVEDPNFTPQDFRTGETLSNPLVAILIQSLGAVLIVVFIVIYAIKKKSKGKSKHDNN